MAPQPPRRPHRPLDEIEAYAERLHLADPGCTEFVPVSADEEMLVPPDVIHTRSRQFLGFGKRLLGHRLKVL